MILEIGPGVVRVQGGDFTVGPLIPAQAVSRPYGILQGLVNVSVVALGRFFSDLNQFFRAGSLDGLQDQL